MKTEKGSPRISLFEAYGVELEYGIADARTMAVRPVADRLLAAAGGGEPEAEVELGEIAWSNELVMHVLEMKTNGPAASLAGLGPLFQEHARRANALLEPLGARLLPAAMHPWMDPERETKLWPHEYGPVYRTFDRIFGCRGHGWSNLQSTHLNLPFDGDDEFGRLHAAIRLVLPLLPALCASSPVVDGRASRWLDTRMEVYRNNAKRVPSVMGRVVPERAFTEAEYDTLLEGVYADLAPHDPEGILRHPWVNARGCIARFDRGSIEIRVIDSQDCPGADVAVTAAAAGVVRALVEERLSTSECQRSFGEGPLADVLLATIEHADRAVIPDGEYLGALGWTDTVPATAVEVWRHLMEAAPPEAAEETAGFVESILAEGPLARRILRALGDPPPGEEIGRAALVEVCVGLADSLEAGELFRP